MPAIVDTDVFSYLYKRDSRAVLYYRYLADETKFISFMTLAELRTWTLQNDWGERKKRQLENFIAENYGVIYADDNLCKTWAKIRSDARKNGNPIKTADAWVASVAVLFDIPLVTHNRRHFENVENLKIISEA